MTGDGSVTKIVNFLHVDIAWFHIYKGSRDVWRGGMENQTRLRDVQDMQMEHSKRNERRECPESDSSGKVLGLVKLVYVQI